MKRKVHFCFLLFAHAILFLPSSPAAKIFHWVDEEGKKHFSDKPRNNQFIATAKPTRQFEALAADQLDSLEKLQKLQGSWQQTRSSPSHEDIAQLLATLWNLPLKQQPQIVKKPTVLTVENKRITIASRPKDQVTDNPQGKAQPGLSYSGQLEFYNEMPLDIGGFWSFEQGPNPFISAFLEQVSLSGNPVITPLQVRFDIQGDQLMVTVNLPDEFRVKQLRILYQKITGSP